MAKAVLEIPEGYTTGVCVGRMNEADSRYWGWLEENRSAAFVGSGSVWIIAALLSGLDVGFDTIAGLNPGRFVLPVAFLGPPLLAIGLLGLYRSLRTYAPELIDYGAFLAVASGLVTVVFDVAFVLDTTSVSVPWPASGSVIIAGVAGVAFVVSPFGSVLFGIVSSRTQVVPSGIGALLMTPLILCVLWLLLYAHVFFTQLPAFLGGVSEPAVDSLVGAVATILGLSFVLIGSRLDHSD